MKRWRPADRTFRDADGEWSINRVVNPSTPQSRMFEEIRRERARQRGEYRGVVTWKYDGPDLGPEHPYPNQAEVRSPNE